SSSNLSTQQSDLDLEAADCSIEGDIDIGNKEFSDEESPESPSCSYAGKRVRSKTDKLNILAITVKKLPNKGINEVKMKSLALVMEIQEKYSAPDQPRITSVVPDHTNCYQLSSLQAVSDPAVLQYPMSLNYSGFGNYHIDHGEQ
ncbi:Uncharacterized protein FWK35_00035345, partial [Aphis craccivora]